MKVTLSAIKRLIQTGAAVDVSSAPGLRRPAGSTVVYHSINSDGLLNGIVIFDPYSNRLYAVIGRCNNLLTLAA